MATIYESRYTAIPREVKTLDTSGLRDEFLINNFMKTSQIAPTYTHYDRCNTGSTVSGVSALALESIEPQKEDCFLERRELGIINIEGEVIIERTLYALDYKDTLYIGKRNKEVIFKSNNTEEPTKFYMNSALPHHSYSTKK